MKVWNYVYISLTMILILTFAGFETAFTNIFTYFGLSFNANYTVSALSFPTSGLITFFASIGTGWLAVLVGGVVSVGLFISGRSDIAIKAGFATTVLVMFIPVVVYPITYSIDKFAGWVTAILTVIFIPYSVGFIVALVEFVAGGTSD